jgi:hypothetical protein
MESIKMVAVTSRPGLHICRFSAPRSPRVATLSSRRPVIYLPGVIGNIVTYACRDTSAARVKFRSERGGTKQSATDRERSGGWYGRNASWRRKHPKCPLFLTRSYRATMSGFTIPTTNYVTGSPAWRNLSSDSTIQVTVITLLSSHYCHHFTAMRLLSAG